MFEEAEQGLNKAQFSHEYVRFIAAKKERRVRFRGFAFEGAL